MGGRGSGQVADGGRSRDVYVGCARCAWRVAGAGVGVGRRWHWLRALGDRLGWHGVLLGLPVRIGDLILFQKQGLAQNHLDR